MPVQDHPELEETTSLFGKFSKCPYRMKSSKETEPLSSPTSHSTDEKTDAQRCGITWVCSKLGKTGPGT